MMISERKRDMKTWARFLGTDIDAFKETKEVDPEDTSNIIPLTAIVAPDAYKAVRDQSTNSLGSEELIPEEDYEQQCKALEEAGALTEIDSLMTEAENQAMTRRNAGILEREAELARKQEEPIFPDVPRKRRPRIIPK